MNEKITFDYPIANTKNGDLAGRFRNGVELFAGIPYASPPVGDLRFAAPEPPKNWEGVREAKRFGPASPQLPGEGLTDRFPVRWDEDCLYLNVVTPASDDKNRPVYVWIHGGAYRRGQGGVAWYDGTSFASRGDVVVVTINYRLGAFGFTELGEHFGEKFSSSGLNGLLDQIAALKWDLNRYITEKNDIYLPKYIFLYSSYAIISFAPLFLMHKYASLKIFIFNTRFSLILLLIVPFVLTLPIYYIAFDWGRYLHTSYISSLIILLFLIKNKMILFNYKINIQKYNFINKIILPIFFITYCFGWTVPYCCKPEIKSGLFRSIKLGISYYERNGFTLPKYFYK